MKLKTLIYFAFIVFTSYAGIFGQAFTVSIDETEKDCPVNQLSQFHIEVTNNSDNELTFRIIKRRVNIPENWSISLCWDVCFPPWIDTLITDAAFGLTPLPAGETKVLDVDVTPSDVGVGSLRIIIAQIRNLLDTKIIDLTANAVVTGVDEELVFDDYYLGQNYPNPFNPETKIKYKVGKSAYTSLAVYNLMGEKLFNLVSEYKTAGLYEVDFGAANLPTGIYLYRLESDSFVETKRMLLLK